MSEIDNGGPAFPQKEPLSNDWHGMSLRDYFAAKAMQGMLANTDHDDCEAHAKGEFMWIMAENAYIAADAMLAERNRQK